ncbi:hypothetical protein RB594_004183 [Gaeumannomyces avenae]
MRIRHGFTSHDGAVSKILGRAKRLLPPLTFITCHYAYFVGVCLITSVVFWGSSSENFHVSYVDSLYLVISAMTEAGLNTVNLSQLNTWQQVMLFVLIILGSSIWVSIWTVLARKHAFERRFDDIVKAARAKRALGAASPGLVLRRIMSIPRSARSNVPPPGLGDPLQLPTHSSKRPNGLGITSNEGPGPLSPPISREPIPKRASRDSVSAIAPPAETASTVGASAGVATPTPAAEKNPDDAMTPLPAPGSSAPGPSDTASPRNPEGGRIVFADGVRDAPLRRRPVPKMATGRPQSETGSAQPKTLREFLDNTPALRNGQFHDLSSEERDQLGGCEYRALKVLAVIVPVYFVMWQLLGCLALGAWVSNNMPDTATANGIRPWWLGVFNGVSAFNNSGMSLLDANMVPFQQAYFVLIAMGLMILAGNTAYPLFLRLIIWSVLWLLNRATNENECAELKATLEFILKYPRRVYTNLFPSGPTWWLLFMVILLNSVDWVAFELLNFGNPVIESIPVGPRVLDGLFQALAVRSGGFYVVPPAKFYIGLQVLYVIMMYISVYPVVITMRHSNVYEERSLGIYAGDEAALADPEAGPAWPGFSEPLLVQGATPSIARAKSRPGLDVGHALRRTFTPWHGVGAWPGAWPAGERGQGTAAATPGSAMTAAAAWPSRISFISQQIRGQLAHDIWWLVLAVLVIATIETSHFLGDPVSWSAFNIIFEVVSAYGCVGISVGVPFDSFSFSGGWQPGSKLVLCLVMLRGRHRGLPVALDRAVRLPGEQLHAEEEEDHRIRRSMSFSVSRRASVDI